MAIHRVLAIVLIVVGAILLYFGYESSQSLDDRIFETITGRFTDATVWYAVGGAASVVAGFGLLLFTK